MLIQHGSLKGGHLSHIWILSLCAASEMLLLVQLVSILTNNSCNFSKVTVYELSTVISPNWLPSVVYM